MTAGGHPLDAVEGFLRRFVRYPSEHALVAHTLWIAHTHLIEVFESTPRIAFVSPEPASGKTRALEISQLLVPNPVEAVNATPAYVFRKISDPEGLPTILLDEVDAIFGPKAREHEELRGVLNAGHRRGAVAGRCAVRGKSVVTEELPAFCAVALAGLGNLPDTIRTRSVVVRMRKRAPTEHVEPFRHRIHGAAGAAIRDRLAAWASSVRGQVANSIPTMPPGVDDRDADVWEPLLAVADAAGGRWPTLGRTACVSLVTESRTCTPSLGVLLLADIRRVLNGRAVVSTADLLQALHALEEAPWGNLNGYPLDARALARLLRPYGVGAKTIRVGEQTLKGFSARDLDDPFSRYLACAPLVEHA